MNQCHPRRSARVSTNAGLVCSVALAAIAAFVPASGRATIMVDRSEMAQKGQWVRQNLLLQGGLPPFSFVYAGKPSSTLLPAWTRTDANTSLDQNCTQHVTNWTHDGLQVKCVAVEYSDYPEVEWTVYLRNNGSTNSPIIENIQGLDTSLSRAGGPEFVLNGIKGDFTSADSYAPYQTTLGPGTTNLFAPPGSGKSSDGPKGWPYFNLQVPGGGIILAVGWPGEWASSFIRDGDSFVSKTGRGNPHAVDRLGFLAGHGCRAGAKPLAAFLYSPRDSARGWPPPGSAQADSSGRE
jgi:alpha-galactosidase